MIEKLISGRETVNEKRKLNYQTAEQLFDAAALNVQMRPKRFQTTHQQRQERIRPLSR